MPTPQRANTPSSAARKDARATSATRAKPKKSKANDSFISNLATRRPSGSKSRQTKSRSGKSQPASGVVDGLHSAHLLNLMLHQIEDLAKFIPPFEHRVLELRIRHAILARIGDLVDLAAETKTYISNQIDSAIDKAYEDAEPLTSEPSPVDPAAPLEPAKPEQTQTVQIDEPSGSDDVAEFSEGGADEKTSTEDAQ